ncbi:unnamed protein product [Trichobilharzia regenti]|nr:unnamed protein product [Trichobilharzia regenti]
MVVNHSVKDIFEFISNVDDINVNGKQMLSLDVASLFTNVSIIETTKFICQQILEKQFDIRILVAFKMYYECTLHIQQPLLQTNRRHCHGFSIGAILEDFFLAKVENGPLKKLIEKTDSYFRHVDDTFIILDVKADKNEVLIKFNDAHPSLMFTCEEEYDGRLHSLDVQLNRRELSIENQHL